MDDSFDASNLEVFFMGADEFNPDDDHTWMGESARDKVADGFDAEDVGAELQGWYWWFCMPGCMPDSSAFGPFETEEEAWKDARQHSDE